jgi:RimJ/RimL family protein N-acetyltransferase
MSTITLRNTDPPRDFEWVAALISSVDVEATSVNELKEWYQRKLPDDIHLRVAENASGDRFGFHCLYRYHAGEDVRFKFYLIVEPTYRGRGVGAALYEHLEELARSLNADGITTDIRDNSAESRHFAEKRGFTQKSHDIQMMLELASFDDQPLSGTVAALTTQGFRFTTMAELGNGEDVQRKLYELNSSVSATQPGHDGIPAWGSFEEFQRTVCQMGWYKPAGQFIVIDTSSGDWAAMSAITRFENADHAYNLFTGVDPRYRGRKLGQAVKSLALSYARDQLGVDKVRTNHNADNAPMIAIDRKLGYIQIPGTCRMEKTLKGKE